LGFVGESGCGKTVTAYALMRILPYPGIIDEGSIIYNESEITSMDDASLRSLRGGEIAMVFQEPMTAFNPVFTIGYQISEVIRLHCGSGKKLARESAIDLLDQVGIPSPSRRYSSYPHELSGGLRQRAMIAMALSASPSLLIADEPTTALDVTIQAQILDLLIKIRRERNMSLILITHDMGIVSAITDEMAVMYAGEIVEYGKSGDIFKKPCHPYTKGLLKSIPSISAGKGRLSVIPGHVPSFKDKQAGCGFYPRCCMATPECRKEIALLKGPQGRQVRCINYNMAEKTKMSKHRYKS
jgi:oligopeptide/dipeptide ABC transporter ATP-binding protein